MMRLCPILSIFRRSLKTKEDRRLFTAIRNTIQMKVESTAVVIHPWWISALLLFFGNPSWRVRGNCDDEIKRNEHTR